MVAEDRTSGGGVPPIIVDTLPATPALVVGRVAHTRHRPVNYRFDAAYYQWLIDPDHPPVLPRMLRPLAHFDTSDHLTGSGSVRHDLAEFLAARGIDLDPSDRILMLCHGRQAGYVFDPLTLYWCLDPQGALKALVAEVNSTYGDRHAYLVADNGTVDKRMFVSPFNPSRGSYQFKVALSERRVAVTVRLEHGPDSQTGPVLTASMRGRLVAPTKRQLVVTAARHFPMTYRVWLLIRLNAILLRLKGLRFLPVPGKEGSVR